MLKRLADYLEKLSIAFLATGVLRDAAFLNAKEGPLPDSLCASLVYALLSFFACFLVAFLDDTVRKAKAVSA